MYESPSLLITIAFAGLSAGLIIGGGQWLLLRNWFSNGLKWILPTGLSWSIGLILVLTLSDWLIPANNIDSAYIWVIAIGLPLGFLNGIAQWHFIRHYVRNSYLWILASSLGWTVGFAYVQIIGDGTLVDFIVMGVISGIVTGILLVPWLSSITRAEAP